MKRILALTLALVICLSLCSCDLFRKKTCISCGKSVPVSDTICKYCGKVTEREQETAADANSSDAQTNSGGGDLSSTQTLSVNDYVGYWGISGNTQKQLTIHKGDSTSLHFSLEYINGAKINEGIAQIQNTTASFSYAENGFVIAGELAFFSDAITVHITNSSLSTMPVEIMNFNQRYNAPFITSPAPVTTTQTAKTNNYYVLPQSAQRLLTYSDIAGMSTYQLKLARNEIFARHGRLFDDKDLQSHFNSQAWYNGYIKPANFKTSVLNSVEKANVDFLKAYENGTTPTATTANKTSGYILPQSSSRLLTYSDIRGLSSYQLKLARNEIYARHGRLFSDSSIQSYFNSKSWYNGYIKPANFKDSMLSSIEKQNIDFIKSYE